MPSMLLSKIPVRLVLISSPISTDRYIAIKILTANATIGHKQGLLGELELLEHISTANPKHPGFRHCIQLLQHFTAKSIHGEHLCLVVDVLGTHITPFRR